jgi:glycosyltransferase involved in cell wall biosynthesis
MGITSAPESALVERDRLERARGANRSPAKVLVASSSFPYPLDIGRKVVISGFLDYLAGTFGATNVTFAYLGDRPAGNTHSPLPCQSVSLPLDGAGPRLGRTFWHSLVRRRYALQEMVLYSRRAEERLRELERALRPDIVIGDTIRMARYFEPDTSPTTRSILYLDDLYSLRYQRMIDTTRAHPDMVLDAIGTFGRFLPAGLRRATRGRELQQALLGLESRLLERREIELTERFDHLLLLNREETTRLEQRSGARNIGTVKPLLRWHRDRLPRRFHGEPTYLFLGNLHYPANAYSLSLFMARTMPQLIKVEPRAKLLVVGRHRGTGLAEQASSLGSHVEFLDFVEDLAPLMATAAAMVIPLVYGSGLKMKALDALYYGIPMVSTECGVDSIPVMHDHDALIENELSEFVSPLLRLLDPSLNDRISEASQRLYAREFSPEVVWREYGDIFGSA